MNLRKDHYRSFTRTVRTVSKPLRVRVRVRARSVEGARARRVRPPSRARRVRTGEHHTPPRRTTTGERRLVRALVAPWRARERRQARTRTPLRKPRLRERASSPLVSVRVVNHTTRSDGYLGMSNDEERSQMRYVVRIAEFSESSRL